ncbi:recombination regulator RecX [Sporosarcina trichiuri]|uniref:recombination regulator RecX n=1 Tax=Sporosarcina trichiuri TaxID=3056445 RepID=UPI0025B57897|nr:recombination regulator RecX [Sporosarcina sp. 0.2-SM1T-5]WJY27655.1 recombination regulator RecX [Sporosarcina sp. 0.2-SM1T-5]
MPVITKITQQKKDKECFNIFLDDVYSFSVHETNLIKFGLTKGMPLDEWVKEDLVYEEEIQRAFNRALHYLGRRMRSEQEVRQKLLEAEFSEAVTREALLKLKKLGFLDDQAYSEALLQNQKTASGKGPNAIKAEMKKKGIDPEVQEAVLEEYDPAEQLATAKRLADKAARKHSAVAPAQLKQRIQNALQRKGFSFDIIKEAVGSIEFEPDEDEWTSITETAGEKAWRRINAKYKGYERKQRVKQAMYQKGIPFDRIDAFIEKKELEEDGE